jgi:pimeloyl-ACP methyl ester carboxylesterase
MRTYSERADGKLRLPQAILAFAMSTSRVNSAPARGATKAKTNPKPAVVLVHGAFTDASSWRYVAARLADDGYSVLAPANPLRGLEEDSAYLSSVLATIEGPIVLVGHSYGGAVITNAANGNPNVKALVFIVAFALDAGESLATINAKFPDSDLGTALLERRYPLPDGTSGTDFYIDPAKFRNVFAKDLSSSATATMSLTQRPLSASAFNAASSAPAWRTISSWYLVATEDRAIDPEAERFMAERAGAHTVEVKASHAVSMSRPNAVARLIRDAAEG